MKIRYLVDTDEVSPSGVPFSRTLVVQEGEIIDLCRGQVGDEVKIVEGKEVTIRVGVISFEEEYIEKK